MIDSPGTRLRSATAVFAVATLAAAGTALAGPSWSADARPGPGEGRGPLAVSREAVAPPSAVRDYWTPQRMRNARRADVLLRHGKSLGGRAAGPTTATPARPVTVAGTPGSAQVSRRPQLRASSVPAPYTRLPYRTNGKVFFSQGSTSYVCSGTAVNSPNKSVVWTAGHCVHNGVSRFHRNWAFVPAYSSGPRGRPYGVWTAGRLLTTSAWASNEDLRGDLGAAVVRPRNGVRLVNRVGGQGLGFNHPASGSYAAYGYPAAAPFNGYRQWRCSSSLRVRDRAFGSPNTMGIPCNMTGGSSGGGWLRGVSHGVGRVLSVNSYGYRGLPYMFGPYQGGLAQTLYNRARALRL